MIVFSYAYDIKVILTYLLAELHWYQDNLCFQNESKIILICGLVATGSREFSSFLLLFTLIRATNERNSAVI